jgi:hypothetical protein
VVFGVGSGVAINAGMEQAGGSGGGLLWTGQFVFGNLTTCRMPILPFGNYQLSLVEQAASASASQSPDVFMSPLLCCWSLKLEFDFYMVKCHVDKRFAAVDRVYA